MGVGRDNIGGGSAGSTGGSDSIGRGWHRVGSSIGTQWACPSVRAADDPGSPLHLFFSYLVPAGVAGDSSKGPWINHLHNTVWTALFFPVKKGPSFSSQVPWEDKRLWSCSGSGDAGTQ